VPIFFMEIFFGMEIVITGDDTLSSEDAALVIANHRTRLDWFFLWSFFLRRGRLCNEKIVLKDVFRVLLGFGWAMQHFNFLFLSRRWEADEAHIGNILRRFTDAKYPLQLLIFPEGTDLSPATASRSDEWAAKQTPPVPTMDYVLHPRVRGFQYTVQLLRNNIDAVYDVTIGYPDFLPRAIGALGLGITPKQIHYHITRYPIKDLPSDEKELATWLETRWNEKEKNLRKFYEETKSFNFLPSDPKAKNHSGLFLQLVLAISFWFALICLNFYAIFNTWWFIWYLVFTNIFYIVVSKVSGLEFIELKFVAADKKKQ